MTDTVNAIKALIEWVVVGGAIAVCYFGYKQAERKYKNGN